MSEGILAAAATIAAGAAVIYGTDTFKDVDCDKIKEQIESSKSGEYARAQAMADYACKYFQAMQQNAKANMIIAFIQQAASFYFADKQHDVAKQAQNRFDEIWKNQKDKSDKLFNHWYDNSRPIEIGMLSEARAREQQGYQVDYETVKNRAVAQARSEFARARDKVQRESHIHCVGATRTALRQLHAAEARAVVLATNSAIRMEEERKHQRESQYREEVYKWNGLFQGRVGDSLNSIRTALSATAISNVVRIWIRGVGAINKY